MKRGFFILIALLCTQGLLSQSLRSRVDSLNKKSFDLRNDDYNTSRQLATEALKLAISINYELGQSDSYVRLGIFYRNKGVPEEALRNYHIALSIRRKLKEKAKMAMVMDNIGTIYLDMGKKDSSLHYLLESLRIKLEIGNPLEIAKSSINVGNFYDKEGDPLKAIIHHKEASQIYEAVADTESLIMSFNSLGNDYYHKGNTDSSRYYYSKAMSMAENTRKKQMVSTLHNGLGLVYHEEKKFDEAITQYRKALTLKTQKGDSASIGSILLNIGISFLGKKENDSSFKYLNDALIYGKLLKSESLQQDAYLNLSKLSEQTGDFEKALEYFTAYSELKGKGLEMNSKVAEMEVGFDVERKETLIRLLDAETRARTLQRNLLLGGSTFLMLILFLLWRALKQRNIILKRNIELHQQRVNELIHQSELRSVNSMIQGQEEERKRIAQDLHDRLGSMLATIRLHFEALEDKITQQEDKTAERLANTQRLIDQAVEEVRRISHNMEAGIVVKFGLIPALEDLRDSIQATGLVRMELITSTEEARLPMNVEIGVYRIIQELLSNALKHAKATELTLQIIQHEKHLNLVVEDNGIGFDPSQIKKSGMGLKNVNSRAEALGGTVTFDSEKGNGSTIILDIPLL